MTLARLVELLVAERRPEVQACLLEALLASALRADVASFERHGRAHPKRSALKPAAASSAAATTPAATTTAATTAMANVVDSVVARALQLMRADVTRHWTVQELAGRVGVSRAAFARRFTRAMREPPQRWLTRARLEQAAALLAASDDALAGVAAAVGYDSEFAFNRAFRRHFGVAPGVYRRRLRTLGGMGPGFGAGTPIRLAA